MAMDPQIIAAIIVGVASIAAVVIGWWLHQKKGDERFKFVPKSAELDSKALAANRIDSVKLEAQANSEQMVEQLVGLSKIRVKEIVESINSAPPFQTEQIAIQYKGIVVDLTGYLKEVMEDPRDKESVRVNLTFNQEIYIGNSFWFSEKLVNFPEIRTLNRGCAIRVIGEVQTASGPGLCVDLKPISIEIMPHNRFT